MRMATEVQQLHALDGQAQHDKVIRHGRLSRAFLWKTSFRAKGFSGRGPAPQRSTAIVQGLPGHCDGLVINAGTLLLDHSTQSVLMACLSEQPAEFNLWLMVEIGDFSAASVCEEVHILMPDPVAEHKRANPRCVVLSHGGELQPACGGCPTFACQSSA